MKKRYSISKEQCICSIGKLYDTIAIIMGISDVSKAVYDCRKLSITKKVLDCMYEFYHWRIGTMSLSQPVCSCMDQKQIWMVMAMKSR